MQLPVGSIVETRQQASDNVLNIGAFDAGRCKIVEDLYEMARRARQSHEARWKRNYEFYYGCDVDYRKKAAHQSKIVVPISYQLVETSTPRLVLSLLSQDPVYSVNPQSSDDPYKARAAEALLTWQMRQMKNVYLEHTLWIKDSKIFGSSIAKTGWEYDCEFVPNVQVSSPVIDFKTGAIIQERRVTQEKVITADQPILKNVDIGEIFPDPTAANIEDCKYIIHRVMVPYVYLQKMGQMGIFKNVDKINRRACIQHWASDFSSRRYSVHNFTDPFTFDNSIFDYVELLECWWIDYTDPHLMKYKTVIANRNVVVQDIPLSQVYHHNRWPFVLLKNTPMTNEFWSISDIDCTIDLQKELNSLRNQRMDNQNAILKAFWLVERSAGINKERLSTLAPGSIVQTNNINGIKIERPPSLDNLTFNSEMAAYADIQRTTGMTDMALGTPTRSQVRNATTASLLDQNSKTRDGLSALLYLEQMRRIGQDWLALNQQFLTQPIMVSVLGEDGVPVQTPISADMIPRNPDVFVTLGMELQGNKDLRRQLLIQLDALVAQTPGANLTEWRKDLLKEYNIKNPERYFEGEFIMPTEAILEQMGVGAGMPKSDYLKQAAMGASGSGSGGLLPNGIPNVGEAGETTYGYLGQGAGARS